MSNVDRRWLAGPVSDLLWGCGVAYFPVLIMLVFAGPELQALIPLGLLPFGNIVLSIPHYGATLLRVYERREDRQKYSFFTVHLTILVWGLFTVGLFQPTVGSAMYTVYLTWSPWHYAGQNYGLASMFLRRRGIEITPWTKRALRASFLLSFALSFLAMHIGNAAGAAYAPTPMSTFGDFHFYALGLPAALAGRVAGLVLIMYVACLGVAAVGLLRRASLADIMPTALLVVSQALWFTVPIIARSEGFGVDSVAFNLVDSQYAFWWIAFAHSVQYLWVTRYFARSGGTGRHYHTRATFAGFAVFGLPVLIFTSTGLSPVPYDAGLFLMVNTAVNLHHFILDGAIWKLRDGAVARVLLRPVEPSKQVDPGSRRFPWRRIAVVVVASLYMVQYVVNENEKEFGVIRADRDSERLHSAERRLAFIRLPSPMVSARLGIALASEGKFPEAEAALERSIDQRTSALAWTALGQVRSRQQDWPGAEEALTQALALDPDHRTALHELGKVRLTSGDAAGAIAPLERALELSYGEERGSVELMLRRARSAAP